MCYRAAECARHSDCDEQFDIFNERHRGRYVGVDSPAPGQIVAAIFPVNRLTPDEYLEIARKKRSKGGFVGNINRAKRDGFYCKIFNYANHVPDIHAINTSMPIRTGRPMSETYQRNINELGGAPKELRPADSPACPLHHDLWWGVFQKVEGYMQGDTKTNEQLVGYIMLRRNGNYAFYGKILGHGDFLKHGIMHYLHFRIFEWAHAGAELITHNLDYLVYAGYFQGKEGLQNWKQRALFEPSYLIVDSSGLPG